MKKNLKEFQQRVLNFYKENGRSLPWRETQDPYAIMVSEIMLQQTQVDRVIPKYLAFLEKFPDIKSLADGNTADLLKLWSGLGYNNRALRLQKSCQTIMKIYDGKFPAHVDALLKLPGIGPYTARSILIFAFNENVATVDTNIRRIFIHEFSLDEKTNDKELFALAEEVLPYGQSGDWHNALMDYGSKILTSRKTGIKARTKQSKFKGSNRWYRGQILKRLVVGEELEISNLIKEWKKEESFLKKIIERMEKEGLIKIDKNKLMIKN